MKQQKTKKVRAILAGGLVLGVGAAVTLAAWSDSEFAKETFTAGKFNLQGSATGEDGSYTDHADTSGALELDFKGAINNLSPGDTAYAAYWLRLGADSTTGGILTPANVSVPDGVSNAGAISYTISHVTSGSCGDGTVRPALAFGSHLDTLTQGDPKSITLAASTVAGSPGAAVQLCLEVEAADATKFKQGLVTTPTWEFNAVSDRSS